MKYIKSYKLFEAHSIPIMRLKYGDSVLSECDGIIDDIKDMLLELSDIGLHTMVGYTPMTISCLESTPKIIVEVQGDLELCESNKDDINLSFERVKDYVKSLGFVTGGGSWERDNGLRRWLVGQVGGPGDTGIYRVYQILIQK